MQFELFFTPFWRFVLLALVCFEIAWTITKLEGPLGVFGRLRDSLDFRASKKQVRGLAWTVAELFHCPLCLGVWIAPVVFLVYVNFPHNQAVLFILLVLALAGLQSFLDLFHLPKEY